jgi:hypothetical protein
MGQKEERFNESGIAPHMQVMWRGKAIHCGVHGMQIQEM